MKKLILLFILCLFGCGYNAIDNNNNPVIYKIQTGIPYRGTGDDNFYNGCYYYVHGNTGARPFSEDGGYLFDKCGKYTVGDTIIISKK